MSPKQQLALARQQAQLDLLPSLQANARAQAQAKADALNQAVGAKAGYAALAELQGQQPDQIAQTYGHAADQMAAYGSGFSTQVQGALDKSTADANALLAANGSPQHLASNGQSARDVLYSLGGYSPAAVLTAQGAALKTAAQQLPDTSTGLGIDAGKAANAVGQKNLLDLRGQLADLQARRPGLLAQALSGIQSNQSNAYSQFIQGQYLQNTMRNTGANITGYDPVTGQPTYEAQHDASTAVAKTAAARAKAVTKRNDATVSALADATDWVEKQLKPGTAQEKVADMPIKIGMSPAVKDASGKVVVAASPIYAKVGGGTTHDIHQAATKPVYTQVPLPKPQFEQILRQVTKRLSVELRRYGYKPAQIRAFAMDIVDDYYVAERKAKKDFQSGVDAENRRRANRPPQPKNTSGMSNDPVHDAVR